MQQAARQKKTKRMTVKEFMDALIEAAAPHASDYDLLGYRLVNQEYTIGDILVGERSRSNFDREDARDFPDYNTEEYWEMDELSGLSAYNLDTYYLSDGDTLSSYYEIKNQMAPTTSNSDTYYPFADHCYILGSDDGEWGEDDGEIVLKDPVVLARIF